jgi:hypothetical protein
VGGIVLLFCVLSNQRVFSPPATAAAQPAASPSPTPYTLATSQPTPSPNATSVVPEAMLPFTYRARLSDKDHFNLAGNDLRRSDSTEPSDILLQDRLNYYKSETHDVEDQGDPAYASLDYPAYSQLFVNKTVIAYPWNGRDLIIHENPLVEVTVMNDRILVTILEEGAAPPPRAKLVKIPDATPSPQPSAHMPTYTSKDADKVLKLIAAYMQATQKGKPTGLKPYCRSVLETFYGKRNVSLEDAEKDIADYYKVWPKQTTSFNLAECRVEQKSDGSFEVTLPFSWSVSDGRRTKNGISRLHATVCRAADGTFLISAVSNEKMS